jgi:hypothetical protein
VQRWGAAGACGVAARGCAVRQLPPRAAAHAASGTKGRDTRAPARLCSRPPVPASDPPPPPAGVSDRGVVELQAQLYRTQQHVTSWKSGGLDPDDKHVRRKAGGRARVAESGAPKAWQGCSSSGGGGGGGGGDVCPVQERPAPIAPTAPACTPLQASTCRS